MPVATTEEVFSVPPSELFAALADPDSYPHWLVGARRIRSVSADWPQPRSFFEHVVGFGPVAIPDRTTVRSIDPPHALELLVRARPLIEAVVRFEVEPTTTGSTLTMIETPAGIYKIISALAQPLIGARNERSLRRLKAYLNTQLSASDGEPVAHEQSAGDVAHLTGKRQARRNAENESPA